MGSFKFRKQIRRGLVTGPEKYCSVSQGLPFSIETTKIKKEV